MSDNWIYNGTTWEFTGPADREAETAGTAYASGALSTNQQEQMQSTAPAVTILQYEVHSGDTLSQISRAFGITVGELLAANTLKDPNRLRVGQKLDIPQTEPGWTDEAGDRPVVQRVLSSTLTAYTAGKESTGKTPSHPAYGITRSGSKAEEGRTVAVDPSIIPLGSTVLIEGIGLRKAEDTGSAIKGARIDVFMNDLDEAVEFGVKKNVKVFVLGDRSA
ncbi:LysM peptidoglycan-binding domain-containing protein [Paenibacillus ginsengarvi]|uniref:LysM peptidoglycan-binding domain-containing protein n=2 Tax=Paenibacillus ginsengarvi TaxID=400777 RepID=A0A3B0CBF6_9BACL|nr:LysM peptidoglycan-binding domain-containing protein [Paenibacillus ginsengarvi]